jgi:hypothetical protein
MSDFAEHWAARLMPDMKRQTWLAAYRIVTAPENELTWETFNTALAGLENHAHRLGASHMPDEFQRALHEELRRMLVDNIAAVLEPWREAQLRAGMVGADVERWDRQVRQWAQLAAERNISGENRDNVPAEGSP